MTIIEPGTRSPLEQWAVEAAQQIEVIEEIDRHDIVVHANEEPIRTVEVPTGIERVVLTNGLPEGDEGREEATVAHCRTGDGVLVASALHALVDGVRARETAAVAAPESRLSPDQIETILRARHDPRMLLLAVNAAVEAVADSLDEAYMYDAKERDERD